MKPTKNRRGRPPKPPQDQAVRLALMDAAAVCFTEKSYKAVTIRELAEAANTTSAMIRYYFGNKEGLLAAMISRVADENIGNIPSQLTPQLDINTLLRVLISNLVTIHQANPWLARLIIDEVLSGNEVLREVFESRLAGASMPIMLPLIVQLQANGEIRQDLKLNRIMATILAQCVFPFLAQPLLKKMLDTDVRGKDSQAWIDHSVEVLARGLKP